MCGPFGCLLASPQTVSEREGRRNVARVSVSRDSEEDSVATAASSGTVKRTRKEPEPWGLHCCSAGDYDWQANSFHFFQVHRVVPPSRDALKVPCLVITVASCLLFKYRAFSYDLLDCVVKAEAVAAHHASCPIFPPSLPAISRRAQTRCFMPSRNGFSTFRLSQVTELS